MNGRRDVQAQVLVPIGGGYRQLGGFAEAVVEAAPGPVARVAVVPAAGGTERADAMGRAALAESVALIQRACEEAAAAVPRIGHVETVLVEAHQPGDGDRPECTDSIEGHRTDGVFLLGGDQARAMRILAGSRLEEAIAAACAKGAVIGGTSAGAAVQSLTMLAGFSSNADEATGLRRQASELWWGDEDRRGLAVGTCDCVIDQHLFQRGRLGRLLAATVRCAERDPLVVGVGVDVRTGGRITRERISGVFGEGAIAVVDLSAAGLRHQWTGSEATLNAQDLLVHVLPPGPWGYDLRTHAPLHEDALVPFDPPPPSPVLAEGPWPDRLMLGGGLVGQENSAVFRHLISRAIGAGGMLIVLRAYAGAASARAAADAYVKGLRQAGWQGPVDVCFPADSLPDDPADSRAGVILAAGDEAILTTELETNSRLRNFARGLPGRAAVLLDDAMTAAAGPELAAVPRPDGDTAREELASATLRPDCVTFRPGLGLVPAVTEPMLTADHRWGRLLVASSRPTTRQAIGICQATALAVEAGRPSEVVGPLSVVAVDGRAGTYRTGENGMLAALNVLMDCHSAGVLIQERT